MPDILIRGVALPKYGCAGCYFKTGKHCGIISKNENVEEYSLRAERHPDCPIHELPPHGDLIDLQAMLSESENGKYVWAYDLTDLPEFTKDLPVVVPAERRDADAWHHRNQPIRPRRNPPQLHRPDSA